MDFSYIEDWTEEEPAIEEAGEGYRHIWVVAETPGNALHPATLEAMGQARQMADQIGVYVFGLLLGDSVTRFGQHLIAYGADKVLVVDDHRLAQYQPDIYVHALAGLVEEQRPEILLMPATPLGNDLAPRLAQRLNTGLLSCCTRLDLDMAERLLLGTFPVLDGEMYHTMACPLARPQMATLLPGCFSTPFEDRYRSGDIQRLDLDLEADNLAGQLQWTSLDARVDLPPVPLHRARIVVSAGRGMAGSEGFALIERLALALGGQVAGSRGAYDEGWIGEDQIVGVVGTSVSPDLYVACGLSGDIFHAYGLDQPEFIVAINPDEDAPIMKVANLAVVGDALEVIPAMLEALAA
jgi:electron transfer flavoprotein alpha subunit